MLEPLARTLPLPLQNILRGGFWAVGTFFVLSGFVLTHGYASARFDRQGLLRYGAARFFRIYPTYAVSLLIIAPLAWHDLYDPSSRINPQTWAVMAINYLLLLQGWIGTPPVHWNTPAWSLSCEVFFYLLFPAVVILVRRGRAWTWALGAAGLLVPILLRTAGVPDSYKPLIHLGDFLVGAACAGIFEFLKSRFPGLEGRGCRLYLPAGLLGLALIGWPRLIALFCPLNTALLLLNVLILLGLALGGGKPARLLSGKLALLLGHASYSLYILHVPLLWWYKRSALYRFQASWPLVAAVTFTLLAIVSSVLVFLLVEEPLNRWWRGRTRKVSPLRSQRTLSPSLGTVAPD